MGRIAVAICLAGLVWTSAATAATLDRIRESGVLKIGFREDARPYSFKNAIGEPAGFTVALCRAVATSLKRQLGLAEISIDYVPVSAENRFEAVKEGRIDLLCGATTATLSRREMVDFSIATFVDGASVLYLAKGPADFAALAGHKVGVRAGTTTEATLKRSLETESIDADVVSVSSHDEGLRQLEQEGISAYFADRAILVFLATGSEKAKDLRLSKRFFTQEPYALALPRGDTAFRLAVDRALSRIYRSGAIGDIFVKEFGTAEPSDLVRALYIISGLPE